MTEHNFDHPLALKGRRHAREVLADAAQIGRRAGNATPAGDIATALQLVLSAAGVDKVDAQDIFVGSIMAMQWLICLQPEEHRQEITLGVSKGLIQAVRDYQPNMP